eukprot:gene5474-biopygen23719
MILQPCVHPRLDGRERPVHGARPGERDLAVRADHPNVRAHPPGSVPLWMIMEPPERAARGVRRHQPPRAQLPQAPPPRCAAHNEPHGHMPAHDQREEGAGHHTPGRVHAPPAPSPSPRRQHVAHGTDPPVGTGRQAATCPRSRQGTERPAHETAAAATRATPRICAPTPRARETSAPYGAPAQHVGRPEAEQRKSGVVTAQLRIQRGQSRLERPVDAIHSHATRLPPSIKIRDISAVAGPDMARALKPPTKAASRTSYRDRMPSPPHASGVLYRPLTKIRGAAARPQSTHPRHSGGRTREEAVHPRGGRNPRSTVGAAVGAGGHPCSQRTSGVAGWRSARRVGGRPASCGKATIRSARSCILRSCVCRNAWVNAALPTATSKYLRPTCARPGVDQALHPAERGTHHHEPVRATPPAFTARRRAPALRPHNALVIVQQKTNGTQLLSRRLHGVHHDGARREQRQVVEEAQHLEQGGGNGDAARRLCTSRQHPQARPQAPQCATEPKSKRRGRDTVRRADDMGRAVIVIEDV